MSANANLTISVYDNVTVYGDISSLSLDVNGYYNNTVKVSAISLTKDNVEFTVLALVIQGEINKKLNAGFSLNTKLENSTLGFFNLTYMEI
jgi:hypothetical protein